MPNHTHFYRRAILTCKVGRTDLVFGMRSGFISRYVSVCSGYNLQKPWLISRHRDRYRHRQHFNQLIWKAQSSAELIREEKIMVPEKTWAACYCFLLSTQDVWICVEGIVQIYGHQLMQTKQSSIFKMTHNWISFCNCSYCHPPRSSAVTVHPHQHSVVRQHYHHLIIPGNITVQSESNQHMTKRTTTTSWATQQRYNQQHFCLCSAWISTNWMTSSDCY